MGTNIRFVGSSYCCSQVVSTARGMAAALRGPLVLVLLQHCHCFIHLGLQGLGGLQHVASVSSNIPSCKKGREEGWPVQVLPDDLFLLVRLSRSELLQGEGVLRADPAHRSSWPSISSSSSYRLCSPSPGRVAGTRADLEVWQGMLCWHQLLAYSLLCPHLCSRWCDHALLAEPHSTSRNRQARLLRHSVERAVHGPTLPRPESSSHCREVSSPLSLWGGSDVFV